MKLNHQCTPYTKINWSWIKYLNITWDIIKVLEENIGSKISYILYSIIFADISLTTRDIKEQINKCNLIKIKSFCRHKENIIKMKREATIWENILANDVSDKGLIFNTYKELIWLNSRKTNNPIKKWAKNQNRHFSKEDIQRAQRHMKGCSASLLIREMQIKTTMRYHFTSVRMVIINKSTKNKCWRGHGGKGTQYTLIDGNTSLSFID